MNSRDTRSEYLKLANASQPTVEHPKPSLAFRALKRGFDVAASLAGLVVLSPLLLGTAVAVKATSPGPAIFKQERYGRDKRPFTCYKFRSMTVDTPSDVPTRVMHEDRSVMTPIGAALRRTSIDELPQLVNIVKGDMSLIGPRPERPAFCAEFEKRIHGWHYRTVVTPGLLGLAQVTGGYDLLPKEKVLLDLWKGMGAR